MTESSKRLDRVVAIAVLLAMPGLRVDQAVAAEGPARDPVPEFSLPTASGKPLSVHRAGGRVRITHGKQAAEPRALVLHFFQPDCLQCQSEAKALEAIHQKYAQAGVSVVGFAHRGDARAVQAFAEQVRVSYPLVLGTGSETAGRLAAGDTLYVADEHGAVRFSQPGYGSGDEKLWRETIDLLLAGKPVVKETSERENLKVGDRLPTVRLDSLMNGGEMSLTGSDGHLTFTDASGSSIRPRAAVGLFARYCAFTREEMVQLQKLHEKYRKDGLLVFTIALHPRPETARELTRKLGLTYPVFQGHGSDLERRYGYG